MIHRVPFTIDVFGGLGTCEGLLLGEPDCLSLQFQVKDAVLGVLAGEVRQVRVPLDKLVSVTLTKGWLGTTWLGVKIVIQAAELEPLADVPGMSQGRVELCIARKDRAAAEEFVDDLYQHMSQVSKGRGNERRQRRNRPPRLNLV